MDLVSLASKGIQKSYFFFYSSYDKPCGELALGENCIKIISQDKSNYLGMFLEIHLIPKWRLSQMIWVELHENEASRAKRGVYKCFYRSRYAVMP